MSIDERAKQFVREMRAVVSFGKDSVLGHMIWSAIERAFKMGYAAGIEDAGKPARRSDEHP